MNYLTIRNLHKSFSHKIVFEDLHMTINAGQKVALVAANGAGKTTLLRTITGEETYPEGVIQRSDKITMGVLSQETKLDPDLTVLDTLFDDSSAKATLIKQYEHIINMKDFDQKEYETIVHEIDKIDAWSYESRVRTIIAQLQLTPYLEQKVSTLS